jgi:nucleoid-associated protein YgaU
MMVPSSLLTPTYARPNPRKVKEGDTLWQIAQEVYGDGNRWRQIRDANLWILDPDRIQAGWWIQIP